ncbi:conserved hypothetical protein [Uncinocarpus reesii 1704]|uniref:t-SNARE coiled-coil homology domain-containing protein n=1 Tax=Uncinocarpus reesii (strain UAMH 1704) TaxID=336963 RepID=C4JEM8_UNCRE|nr:uncharacterized protein UREG_02188 [Uncinocarpus reesii 1704]EEP77339.1 conserved hypothetical protein [Uncinocarpus reesii 1704]
MSLKQEIETWVQALGHYDNNEFEDALKSFSNIADTSKILFNCGVIYATLGEHAKAVDFYQRAIALDKYFAIAYFQEGVSNFLLGDFEEALVNFNDTLLYLRGNTSIDYEQLGLKFQLFSCEVLFNRGLSYIYLNQIDQGMQDLDYASKEKFKPDHDVIDEAIKESAEGYTVFSIPVGVVYRPSEAKVKNLKTKEYLGKARLVAASDRGNAFIGFQGSEIKRTRTLDTGKDDRPTDAISYAATNLVQKNLVGRGRQQSEPPINRNMFPPTPPPDNDKPQSFFGGSSSANSTKPTRSTSVREPPFPVVQRSMDNGDVPQVERLRIGATRSASESRGPGVRSQFPAKPRNQNQPLYRETTGDRRQKGSTFIPLSEEEDASAIYNMYSGTEPPRSVYAPRYRNTRQPVYPDEDGYESDAYEDDSIGDTQFEMIGAPPPARRRTTGSRRSDIKKIRVKVHADQDTRFIMIGPSIEFGALEGKIRGKFGFKSKLKIKMRDDGDMVTLGDQDDLDMLLQTAKQVARRENNEMAPSTAWPVLHRFNCFAQLRFCRVTLQDDHESVIMADITFVVNGLLKSHGVSGIPNREGRRAKYQTVDEFLKEAYRISIRQAYLSTAPRPPVSRRQTHQSSTSIASLQSGNTSLHLEQHLTDEERDSIDSSTAILLRDLSSSIENLASAETLRQETQSSLFRKKFGYKLNSRIWKWAGGGADGAEQASRSAEQEVAEDSEKTMKTVRENVLWLLRRRLEAAVEVQRAMVEKRIERAKEKEKSILYKSGRASVSGGAGAGAAAQGRASEYQAMLDDDVAKTKAPVRVHDPFVDEKMMADIESQLSPEQLQLFAQENDTMLKHYEDTLSKVQNAEKSLLEIGSLQQTLVAHLSTQEDYISQLVTDASTTHTNIGRGNQELKRANERKSTARAVFWGTVGLCTGLIIWDAIF